MYLKMLRYREKLPKYHVEIGISKTYTYSMTLYNYVVVALEECAALNGHSGAI